MLLLSSQAGASPHRDRLSLYLLHAVILISGAQNGFQPYLVNGRVIGRCGCGTIIISRLGRGLEKEGFHSSVMASHALGNPSQPLVAR